MALLCAPHNFEDAQMTHSDDQTAERQVQADLTFRAFRLLHLGMSY